jgi:hypothetical protein
MTLAGLYLFVGERRRKSGIGAGKSVPRERVFARYSTENLSTQGERPMGTPVSRSGFRGFGPLALVVTAALLTGWPCVEAGAPPAKGASEAWISSARKQIQEAEYHISADAKAIDLTTSDGARALRYAELNVVDATGRALPAGLPGYS